MKEEVAANNIGSGNIAGAGVGPDGEPGVSKKRQRKLVILRRKTPGQVREDVDTPTEPRYSINRTLKGDKFEKPGMNKVDPKSAPSWARKHFDKNPLDGLRSKAPANMMEDDQGVGIHHDHFAGHKTFRVPSHDFLTIRDAKRKGKHWKSYIGMSQHGEAIRQYANSNHKKPVIIQDERTGAMVFARYGKK